MDAAASLTTDDLDYVLPAELVAQHPAPERGASRLMVLEAGSGEPIALGRFDELLLGQLREDDLVIANDARVLHARIPVQRATGGVGEALLLAPAETQPADAGRCRWSAMARPARKYRDGMEVATVRGDASLTFVERSSSQTWTVELPVGLDEVPAWLLAHGELPLPPYVTERGQDEGRYQTVHARVDGSVAAPTAGLHFDDELWARVRDRCEVAHVTLHVGAGTFLPVSDGSLDEHVMHHERYEVSEATDIAVRAALAAERRVVAVGTTTTRVLEHVYATDTPQLSGSTDLFIVPGHEWSCVGALLTNFHLPRSTLIALVMSFLGRDETRRAYARAIEERMRFYSFGDAMFVHGRPVAAGDH
ncbi:MAG: S-adenosylmethionine/tRNA-ribosyltransferase-isomerase [Thermoleophilia bacterium]|nr:S-adenosylmethionine/tRNA-ribosyltransferase-isomerase [Thermoleophilia bacterium]